MEALRRGRIGRLVSGIGAKRRAAHEYELIDEDTFPILSLPVELSAHVCAFLDVPTRLALKVSCRGLYSAEAMALRHFEEIALYRTDEEEFTLSLKDALSDTWQLVQSVDGFNMAFWKDDDRSSRDSMERESKNAPFRREATPIGELKAILASSLSRAEIGTFKIDGFHCSESSLAELCSLMRHSTVQALSLVCPFSTDSDARLYELIYHMPRLRTLTLAIHRCTDKATVVERDWLLLATRKLRSLVIHSRALRHPMHSEDGSEVDDGTLLQLLSGKCTHLDLLYFFPLLTPEGIARAVEYFASRNLPEGCFKVYFRSVLSDRVWEQLGLRVAAGEVWSENDEISVKSLAMRGHKAHLKAENVTVTVLHLSKQALYCKLIVETAQSEQQLQRLQQQPEATTDANL